MQVSCTQCGAKYEFDASAIPSAGYDAQCTTCSAVFFVAPEAVEAAVETPAAAPFPEPVAAPEAAAPAASGNEPMSIACGHCGAVYQFAAADIPANGYDAQCTQCQAVFFVSPQNLVPTSQLAPQGASELAPVAQPEPAPTAEFTLELSSEPPPEPPDAAPIEAFTLPSDDSSDLTQPAASDQAAEVPSLASDAFTSVSEILRAANQSSAAPAPSPESFAPQTLHRGTMDFSEFDAPTSPADAAAASETEEESDSAPSAAPEGDDPYGDVLAINAEMGEPIGPPTDIDEDFEVLRLMARKKRRRRLAFLASAGLLTAVALWAVPRTLVKHTPKPNAVARFSEGRRVMLRDTDNAYQTALAAFAQALDIDPQYDEALAWTAVAHALRGADLRAAGNAIYQQLGREKAELRGLPAHGGGAHADALRAHARQHGVESTDLFEASGGELSQCWASVRRAGSVPKVPIVAEAAAVCASAEPDGLGRAEASLTHAQDLRHAAAPSIWASYVEGQLRAAERGGLDKARAALSEAIKVEPGFVRARWSLAALLGASGQRTEAKQLLESIVADVPEHERAKALLASLAEVKPKATVTASEPVHERDNGKAKRRRRHR